MDFKNDEDNLMGKFQDLKFFLKSSEKHNDQKLQVDSDFEGDRMSDSSNLNLKQVSHFMENSQGELQMCHSYSVFDLFNDNYSQVTVLSVGINSNFIFIP